MTRATYNTDNTITEQSRIPEPDQHSFSHKFAYEDAMAAYNAHVATLRRIPCSPECRGLWAEGQVLEENKDYEVRDYPIPAIAPPDPKFIAFPLGMTTKDWNKVGDDKPEKSDEHLWTEVVHYLKNNPGLSDNTKISDLRNSFSLTKR